MSDYSEQGAVPVEDAVVEDPPTIDDVLEGQRDRYPEQAATSSAQTDTVRDALSEDLPPEDAD